MKNLIVLIIARILNLDLHPVPSSLWWIIEEAFPLVQEAAKLKDVDDEYRRHWVYSRMIKKTPGVRRRHLGLAIELAVQRLS